MKCKIKMTDKLLPVDGSVRGPEGKETGTCPECLTPGVMLSIVGGFVRAHTVASEELPENNPQPATLAAGKGKKVGTGLSEPLVTLVDTGVRSGDPRAAETRRHAFIEGAAGIGVVQVPRRVPSGGVTKTGKPRMTSKMTDVPATEEHVREALEFWRKRNVTSDGSRRTQNEMVSSLARRLEGIMSSQVVRYDESSKTVAVVTLPLADQPQMCADVDTAQSHRGPTLVRGRDVAPRVRGHEGEGEAAKRLRDPRDPAQSTLEPTDLRRNGQVRKSTSFEQPLGRERFDRKITDVPEPKPRRTAAARRRYRAQLQALVQRQAQQA